MTSLHISSEQPGAEDIVSTLATESCDVNARNKLGRTALHLASKLGNLQNLKKLLDAGCDRNIKDKLGFTAVGLAFKFNQKGSADVLLHYKPRRNRSSSKESVLDENNNRPVKCDHQEGKVQTDITHCLGAEACSKFLNSTTSFNSKLRKKSFRKLCDETFLKLTERMAKEKALPRSICYLMLTMVKWKRDKIDGLATSRRTRYFGTLLEKEMLTLILGFTSPSQFTFPFRSLTDLDVSQGQLCLCELKTSFYERHDSHNVQSDFLWKLLQDLKDSLVRSRIPSASLPLQRRNLLLPLIKSKENEPALVDFETFTQMLSKICNSRNDDSRLQKFSDNDAEESLLKLDKNLPISDSGDDKDKLQDSEGKFVAPYKIEDCAWCLDHVINMRSTPASFVEDLLEFLVQNSNIFILCLKSRDSFFSAILSKCLTRESIWTADKIARLFLQVCVALSTEQRLLLKCAGAVMKQGLLNQHCNAVSLGTCILVRMGLLKGEHGVDIVMELEGPLTALEHIFTEEYFPRNLSGIFASFLCKSSPKLFGMDQLRLRALASAVTKEVLPTSSKEAESDTGESFKRICDIVALEGDWELLFKCADKLLVCVFETLKCRVMQIGESLLIYLGLLKSEFCIEIVRNLNCALRLLHHTMKQDYFPLELKQMFLCFLQKPNPNLCSCCTEVDDIMSTLLQSPTAGK